MKAAIFHGPNQPLTIEQVDIDDPQDHEVRVRTAATGVCHSDLHFVEGLYPHPFREDVLQFFKTQREAEAREFELAKDWKSEHAPSHTVIEFCN